MSVLKVEGVYLGLDRDERVRRETGEIFVTHQLRVLVDDSAVLQVTVFPDRTGPEVPDELQLLERGDTIACKVEVGCRVYKGQGSVSYTYRGLASAATAAAA